MYYCFPFVLIQNGELGFSLKFRILMGRGSFWIVSSIWYFLKKNKKKSLVALRWRKNVVHNWIWMFQVIFVFCLVTQSSHALWVSVREKPHTIQVSRRCPLLVVVSLLLLGISNREKIPIILCNWNYYTQILGCILLKFPV